MDCLSVKSPIYIVSKGRWERPLTANVFLKHNVPFRIAVEPQEADKYANVLPKETLLILPFSNLGMGSFPARNYVWDHAVQRGHSHHFVFDDNISSFARLDAGQRLYGCDPWQALSCLEKLSFRYANLAISGFKYAGFASNRTANKPFRKNVYVYSGILIRNDIPFRWRLKYNEDVDLCLQALNSGWCTVLLNAFLINKTSTSAKMKGGNQDELYKGNDPKKKALKASSLQAVWPQYAKVIWRFGRPHHHVNWKKHFRQGLIRRTENG